MAAYNIFFRESVEKDFNVRPKKDTRRILRRIQALTEDPRPSDCEKLTGHDRYRIRQDRYRIVYFIQDEALTIWVVTIGHRKDVYR
jgi:mRNA interferase RelE/StbE